MGVSAVMRTVNPTEQADPILIVGLGKSGLSVARHLGARSQRFAVADSRETPPNLALFRAEFAQVPLLLGRFDAEHFSAYKTLIVSPGVSLEEPAIRAACAAGARIVGDIELFAGEVQAPVIAITGSNGKSTVTTLVAAMAEHAGRRVAVGGNLGTPALDLLAPPAADVYVLELSSFQLETTYSLAPKAAVVLNLSPDHLDRYADMDAYAQAKAAVYRNAAVCVVNRDDAGAAALAGGECQQSFGLDEPKGSQFGICELEGANWLCHGTQALMPQSAVRMAGRHGVANALAALALGEAIGLPMAAMLEVLQSFTGLAHRCQWVAKVAGVDWYNDSKGTNVGATLAAVNGLSAPVVVILGGIGKGQDFTVLRETLSTRARAVVVFGQDRALIGAALRDTVSLTQVSDLAAAVNTAAALAQPGDAVLLSPACASFDQFSGFEARGDYFMHLVQERVQ